MDLPDQDYGQDRPHSMDAFCESLRTAFNHVHLSP